MMILVYAVIYASGQAAIGSTVRSFGALWGRSILGEYDRTLKNAMASLPLRRSAAGRA